MDTLASLGKAVSNIPVPRGYERADMLGEAYLALNTRSEDDPGERVRAHFREAPRDRLLNGALSFSAPLGEGACLEDLLWSGSTLPVRPLEPWRPPPGTVLWAEWLDGRDAPGYVRRSAVRGNHGGGHVPVLVEAFGEIKSIPDWAKDPRCTVVLKQLRNRLKTMPPEEALTRATLGSGRQRKEVTPCTTN